MLDDRVIAETLIGHVRRIRAIDKYKDSTLVLCTEIGSSWPEAGRVAGILTEYNESQSVKHIVRAMRDHIQPRWAEVDITGILKSTRIPTHGDLGPMIILSSRDKDDRWAPGIITGPQEKIGGAFKLRRALARDLLVYAEHMVSGDNQEYRDTLTRQLKNFRRDVKQSKDAVHGQPHITFTGKTAMDPDDLASSIALLAWRYEVMSENPAFRDFCSRQGFRL